MLCQKLNIPSYIKCIFNFFSENCNINNNSLKLPFLKISSIIKINKIKKILINNCKRIGRSMRVQLITIRFLLYGYILLKGIQQKVRKNKKSQDQKSKIRVRYFGGSGTEQSTIRYHDENKDDLAYIL